MMFDEYMSKIFMKDYRGDPKIPLELPVADEKGSVQVFAKGSGEFSRGSVILTKSRTIRGNHYHRENSHIIYILDGSAWYFWRHTGETKVEERHFFPSEAIYTPPMVEHALFFPRASTIFVLHRLEVDDRQEVKMVTLDKEGAVKVLP